MNIIASLNHLQSPIYEAGRIYLLEGVVERSHLPVEGLDCVVEVPGKNRDDVTGAEERWIRIKIGV